MKREKILEIHKTGANKEKGWRYILISLGPSAFQIIFGQKLAFSSWNEAKKNALSGFKRFFFESFKRDETEMDFHYISNNPTDSFFSSFISFFRCQKVFREMADDCCFAPRNWDSIHFTVHPLSGSHESSIFNLFSMKNKRKNKWIRIYVSIS